MRTRERLGGVRDHPGRYPPPLGVDRSFRGPAGGAGGRRYAVSRGDAVALTEAAHSPKPSSANLGAVQLAALRKKLEQRGQERRLENSPDLLASVESQYAGVQRALALELGKESVASLGCG